MRKRIEPIYFHEIVVSNAIIVVVAKSTPKHYHASIVAAAASNHHHIVDTFPCYFRRVTHRNIGLGLYWGSKPEAVNKVESMPWVPYLASLRTFYHVGTQSQCFIIASNIF